MRLNEILLQILTTKCEHLDYGGLALTDLDLEKICTSLLENPDVKNIGLWMNRITDCGAQHIITLLKDPRCVIEKIDLSHNNISVYGMNQISGVLSELDRTIEVDLNGNPRFISPSLNHSKIGYRC